MKAICPLSFGHRMLIQLSILCILTGCATIMGTPYQVIPVSSKPSDASISIVDERGMEVFNGKTPATVSLQKSDNSYWGKKHYMVNFSKPGFQTQTVSITANANGWYIAGNLIFGGLIGWFVIDPLSGNMYTLSPEYISPSMADASGATNQTQTDLPQSGSDPSVHSASKSGEIHVVLLDSVPTDLQQKMIPINH